MFRGFAIGAALTLVVAAAAADLSPLLKDSYGVTITSRAGWMIERARVKAQWQMIIGELPEEKPSLQTEIVSTEKLSGFNRQFVRYQVEPGVFTDGYLLTPTPRKGKLPAVVVFHPTTPFQARGVAGLEPDYAEDKWMGVHLVRRGFIVWCPRNYINAEGTDWKGNASLVLARHTNWTGMARMVWDAIRAADFLESLPEVDRKRIGCIGHSLGGKEVLYAMAFDERYRAGVSSEGGIGLSFSNWEAPWYLGTRIQQPGFTHENHEVLALIAPRAFLLLAGDSADGERSRAFIEAVKPVYELLGESNNLHFYNHHRGHAYPPEARAEAEAFLGLRLRK